MKGIVTQLKSWTPLSCLISWIHTATKFGEVQVKQRGRMDAIVFWWRCYMLRGDTTASMTNAPFRSKLQREIDHWRQAVCVLPHPSNVEAGETIFLEACHTDEDIWFRMHQNAGVTAISATLPKACSNLALLSSNRLWMLSDSKKYWKLQQAMDKAVQSLKVMQGQIQVGYSHADCSQNDVCGWCHF